MADIDLKTSTPDTSLPTTGFLFGADSQAASAPSVFTTQAVATTLLGSTTLSGATITADAPVLNLAQTWNASGVTFTGLRFNATDTASAAGSLLMDLQVGGSSKVSVRKDGRISGDGANPYILLSQSGGTEIGWGTTEIAIGNGTINLNAIAGVNTSNQFSVGASTLAFGTSINTTDVYLTRRAAANLRLGAADAAAPVAQTLSVQSGTAGASALSCSISGTTLTVGGAVTGTIAIGHAVTGTGVSAGTVITAGSGTTWTVNNSQTVSSTTMYFNSVGQNLTITGSQGSGPSAGGSIVFQVAPAGSAATTAQNALVDAFTISSNRRVTVAENIVGPLGNTGAVLGGLILGFNNVSSSQLAGGQFQLFEAGTLRFRVTDTNFNMYSSAELSWSSTASAGGAPDVRLFRDAANTLALRNGANAQAFRVYNTTDGTNSEFGSIKWNSNVLEIASEIAGTGTRRPIAMVGGIGPYTLLKSTDYGTYLRQISSSSGLNLYNNDANAQAAQSTGRVAYLEGGTGICLSSSFEIKFSSGADAASSHDSGIARSATGVLRLTNASTGGGALQLTEMTAPAAPATNNVRIYAEDNGSGKTRLMALFATGAAVQIAIEP